MKSKGRDEYEEERRPMTTSGDDTADGDGDDNKDIQIQRSKLYFYM